ncbi:hypothetical protein [Chroococcidiopsis sp. CCNUC1]|uniref:hypothetical protein n=1 Tax=Chroococcidiopsis sp. CCNUC1 TaxID=2653189 RepID=UPI00202019BD|nr:hypothetical protein [Chroococcidiopsis sp. CCNUC1]URD51471.1 hypothetical protein M5J74_05675 [Chroococcidiopsis sp. CCNUC1]
MPNQGRYYTSRGYRQGEGVGSREQGVGSRGKLRNKGERGENSLSVFPRFPHHSLHSTPHTPHPTPHTLSSRTTPHTPHPTPHTLSSRTTHHAPLSLLAPVLTFDF